MKASQIVFYILSAVVLISALLSVSARKIFRSAVYLLFSLIGIAGIYFYLDYEFLGAVQIAVYVGGIVVLLIFSIFLTHESGSDMKKPKPLRAVFSVLASIFAFALTVLFIIEQTFVKTLNASVAPSVRNIGIQMLSTSEHGYILPFEVVSMLLLSAMIGCIVIAIKVKPEQ